jgi:Ca2+/Na+ antiporter
MSAQIARGLKFTFLVHLVVAGLFGLGFLLVPELLGSLYGIKAQAPDIDIYRLLGGAMMGWGVGSWLAFKAETWESVRIVVAAEIVWTALGALVMLYALLFNGFPALGWLNCAIFAAFAAVFAWFYFKK